MTEFTEYSVAKHWGKVDIARKLSAEEREFETCVVSHPDAGGPCGRAAIYEVYGLAFCEPHGLEVNYAALQELYHQAGVALEQIYNEGAMSLHPEIDTFCGAAAGIFHKQTVDFSGSYDELAAAAFPLLADRVRPDTWGWQPGELGFSPGDEWREETWTILRFMREARTDLYMNTVDHLEYLREQTAAQAAYAYEIQARKIAEHRKEAKSSQ